MAKVSRKISSLKRNRVNNVTMTDVNFVAKSPTIVNDYHRHHRTNIDSDGNNIDGRKVYNGSQDRDRRKKRRLSSSIEADEEDTEEDDNGFPIIAASEGPIIVTFGGIQLLAGSLMVTFGVLTLLHDASLSSVGAGFWGGAMAGINGIVGILAGCRGCYQKTDHVNPLTVTVYLALCLVSIGVANLALVLTATGLLRDSQRPVYFVPLRSDDGINSVNSAISSMDIEEQLRPNWSPILTNLGLLLITSVECLVTITAAFRCYWYVSSCRHRRDNNISNNNNNDDGRCSIKIVPDKVVDGRFPGKKNNKSATSADIASTSYCSTSGSSGKQKLVRQWLGQQHQPFTRSPVPFYPPPPPPPPNFSLPPPYYTIDRNSKPRYASGSYASCYSDYNYTTPYYSPRRNHSNARTKNRCYTSSYATKESARPLRDYENNEASADTKSTEGKCKSKDRSRKISAQSIYEEDDIDKSYTGMDREIAEEFISVVMEPKRG